LHINRHRIESVGMEYVKNNNGLMASPSGQGMAPASEGLQPNLTGAGTPSGLEKGSFDYFSLSEDDKTKLDKQIEEMNKSIAHSGKELHFKYNDEAKQLYVEVVDSQTKKVVTSLPPEFLIDLSIKMKEMIGMFMDEKV
jgi:flagellar protein FlaG